MSNDVVSWGNLADAAATGSLRVDMNPDVFVALNKACSEFMAGVVTARDALSKLGAEYGLGEHDAKWTSAVGLASHFRDKLAEPDTGAIAVFSEFHHVAGQVQAIVAAIFDRYAATEDEFSARMQDMYPGRPGGN